MHGNVRELCNDMYTAEYYSTSISDNPYGPSDPKEPRLRCARGGSWYTDETKCRSSSRFYVIWDYVNSIHGYNENNTYFNFTDCKIDLGIRVVRRAEP